MRRFCEHLPHWDPLLSSGISEGQPGAVVWEVFTPGTRAPSASMPRTLRQQRQWTLRWESLRKSLITLQLCTPYPVNISGALRYQMQTGEQRWTEHSSCPKGVRVVVMKMSSWMGHNVTKLSTAHCGQWREQPLYVAWGRHRRSAATAGFAQEL